MRLEDVGELFGDSVEPAAIEEKYHANHEQAPGPEKSHVLVRVESVGHAN
jgi:hypothetical protein